MQECVLGGGPWLTIELWPLFYANYVTKITDIYEFKNQTFCTFKCHAKTLVFEQQCKDLRKNGKKI